MLRQCLTLLGIAIALGVSGCGGEETPVVPPVNTAEGLWSGTTNTNRTLTTAVLDDGTYYVFYSGPGNPNQIGGVMQGTGTSNSGSFASSNTKDFGIAVPVLDATLAANYAARQFLNGSIAYLGTGTVTFTSSYNSAYDTRPPLASLAGIYAADLESSVIAAITVAADGTFTGTGDGCTVTGRATARTRGNVFDQSMTFGGVPCVLAGSTFSGIMFLDIPTRRLYAANPNGSRTNAVIFSGTKIL